MSQGGPGLPHGEAKGCKAREDAGTSLFVPFSETGGLLSTSHRYRKSEHSTRKPPCSGTQQEAGLAAVTEGVRRGAELHQHLSVARASDGTL